MIYFHVVHIKLKTTNLPSVKSIQNKLIIIKIILKSLTLSYTLFYVQSLEIIVFNNLSKRLKNYYYYYWKIANFILFVVTSAQYLSN